MNQNITNSVNFRFKVVLFNDGCNRELLRAMGVFVKIGNKLKLFPFAGAVSTNMQTDILLGGLA